MYSVLRTECDYGYVWYDLNTNICNFLYPNKLHLVLRVEFELGLDCLFTELYILYFSIIFNLLFFYSRSRFLFLYSVIFFLVFVYYFLLFKYFIVCINNKLLNCYMIVLIMIKLFYKIYIFLYNFIYANSLYVCDKRFL